MENKTNLSLFWSEDAEPVEASNRFKQPSWIAAECLGLVFIIFVSWIGFSVLSFGIRNRKWKKDEKNSISQINAGGIYTCTLLAVFADLIRLAINQVTFNIGYEPESDILCEVLIDTSCLLYILSFVLVYLVLWLRQYSLLSFMSAIYPIPRRLKWLTWGGLGVVLSSGVGTGFVYIWPTEFASSDRGCTTNEHVTIDWPHYLAFAVMCLAQGSILFLFFYSMRFQVHGTNAARIAHILKRCTAVAGLLVASNLLVTLTIVFALPEDAQNVRLTTYDFNMCVVLFGLLLSFETWPQILTCARQDLDEPQVRASNTTLDCT